MAVPELGILRSANDEFPLMCPVSNHLIQRVDEFCSANILANGYSLALCVTDVPGQGAFPQGDRESPQNHRGALHTSDNLNDGALECNSDIEAAKIADHTE